MERSEERFSRNAETDIVCRLLLEKKKSYIAGSKHCGRYERNLIRGASAHVANHTIRDHAWFSALHFLFHSTAASEIYTLSLHDALPIYHKATYFASYLTGGDCVPDDQN